MFINYFLWLIMGLSVGYLGHYFDLNKMKGVELYLIVGTLIGYLIAFALNFILFPVKEGEINFVVLIVAGFITYYSLRVIDFFFHL